MCHPLHINEKRLQNRLQSLAQIGATTEGGVHRPALSAAHLQAQQWFAEQATQAHLTVCTDGAGNHSARLAGTTPDAPTLLLGSHLDTVPNGGRFDGALGVVCALEVLQTIQETAIPLAFHLEAISFTDEEGTHISLLGSRALTGQLTEQDLEHPLSGRAAWQQALARAGLSVSSILSAKRDPHTLAGYLEVHIEQGPRLTYAQTEIGIVTRIVGIGRHRLTFVGRADHAGTMPLANRRDASLGACAFTLAARACVLDRFPGCVVNVGQMDFAPGAFNVVPQTVDVALEFRSPYPDQLTGLEQTLIELAHEQATKFDLDLEDEPLETVTPTPMNPQVQQLVAQATRQLGLGSMPMPSGAGHDAQAFAPLCPTGMIFVPSVGGYSHSPQECSTWQDCINGANTLLHTTLAFANIRKT